MRAFRKPSAPPIIPETENLPVGRFFRLHLGRFGGSGLCLCGFGFFRIKRRAARCADGRHVALFPFDDLLIYEEVPDGFAWLCSFGEPVFDPFNFELDGFRFRARIVGAENLDMLCPRIASLWEHDEAVDWCVWFANTGEADGEHKEESRKVGK